MNTKFVYLIACQEVTPIYIKIGRTRNLYNRISNIQTGCPHKITHVFIVGSEFEEEVLGLEKLLHRLLSPNKLRGEWYIGSKSFFKKLENALIKINTGDFSYDEMNQLPEMNAGPELEIMMHPHLFTFWQVLIPINRKGDIMKVAIKIDAKNIAKEISNL